MPPRKVYAVRLSDSGLEAIRRHARAETGGNMSEMIRTLLAEAIAARHAKARRP